jgi:DNA helicase-2/ATP-dependent DNA helicase PcrA
MPADLNPAQLDAVRTLKGPLLVLAGAGTGKTRVVTYRIAELIRHRVKPERILAVTFTKKAAGEMLERATTLLAKFGSAPRGRVSPKLASASRASATLSRARGADTHPEISTFHSLCVRILRRHIKQLGFPEKFVICALRPRRWRPAICSRS